MNLLDVELVVVVVKYGSRFRWYRSDRELWVLDRKKWHQEFVDAGYDTPALDSSSRFNIEIVNNETIGDFLRAMREYEIDKSTLGDALVRRFPDAQSWWDVGKLFPIMLVDVDKQHVAAFYSGGIPMERYVPDGWTSEFEDFAAKSDEDCFPVAERFWVRDDIDMLAELNRRGQEISDQK